MVEKSTDVNPTSVISFSIDLETQIWLTDKMRETGVSKSAIVRRYLRLGRTYEKVLAEQTKALVNGVKNGEQ